MPLTNKWTYRNRIWAGLLSLSLCGCTPHPPYNNFQKEPPNLKRTATGMGIGALTGTLMGSTVIGLAVGGAAGTMVGIYRANKQSIINELRQQDIQFVEYGDTMTLVIPTDHYFQFDSPKLNDICYAGLNNIIKLLKLYNCSRVYVAGFTDNVGSVHHKKMLSQAQAETMLTFLWANGIPAKLLKAEGYADQYTLGDNHWIRGSAYNRRIEIQWFSIPDKQRRAAPADAAMK